MYIGSLERGGAERVMSNLAMYFHRCGWEVTLVTTYLAREEYEVVPAAWRVCGAEEAGAEPVLSLDDQPIYMTREGTDPNGIARVFSGLPASRVTKSRILNLIRRRNYLRQVWKSLQPDVILSFLGKNNVMALETAKGLGIPVVVSVRSNPAREYKEKRLHAAMLHSFPKAAGIVLQTDEAAAYFPEEIQKKVRVLLNPLNPAFAQVADELEAQEVGAAASATGTGDTGAGRSGHTRRPEIVSVGRLDDNKNQVLVIRAFAALAAEYPEYRVILYGDGPSRSKWEALTAELGLEGRVVFAGQVPDVPQRIRDAEVFILPSKQEGLPNALMEAMSLGLACISTDCPCGGPKMLIEDGRNGLLVPIRDAQSASGEGQPVPEEKTVDGMTRALRRVLSDTALREQLSREAFEAAKAFRPDVVNAEWETYLRGIAGQHVSAR